MHVEVEHRVLIAAVVGAEFVRTLGTPAASASAAAFCSNEWTIEVWKFSNCMLIESHVRSAPWPIGPRALSVGARPRGSDGGRSEFSRLIEL